MDSSGQDLEDQDGEGEAIQCIHSNSAGELDLSSSGLA